ncbi:hypothetical protein BDK51DRAFT_44006 [Blyttiomyces helicus]|uniref:F-box domain-containing protein n=1 Tax=Blyttiomyces helicus TaxID=388810 RepID=A0A4P9W6H1_9FUNG|nr:hypothetical protein BDK51DRAFT_44006 [Blyttiomyces helicus]|eukprot:RKO86963.1 hypothetical protein BDK51DRAFT_44006 [Blyttiomyces helicus]
MKERLTPPALLDSSLLSTLLRLLPRILSSIVPNPVDLFLLLDSRAAFLLGNCASSPDGEIGVGAAPPLTATFLPPRIHIPPACFCVAFSGNLRSLFLQACRTPPSGSQGERNIPLTASETPAKFSPPNSCCRSSKSYPIVRARATAPIAAPSLWSAATGSPGSDLDQSQDPVIRRAAQVDDLQPLRRKSFGARRDGALPRFRYGRLARCSGGLRAIYPAVPSLRVLVATEACSGLDIALPGPCVATVAAFLSSCPNLKTLDIPPPISRRIIDGKGADREKDVVGGEVKDQGVKVADDEGAILASIYGLDLPVVLQAVGRLETFGSASCSSGQSGSLSLHLNSDEWGNRGRAVPPLEVEALLYLEEVQVDGGYYDIGASLIKICPPMRRLGLNSLGTRKQTALSEELSNPDGFLPALLEACPSIDELDIASTHGIPDRVLALLEAHHPLTELGFFTGSDDNLTSKGLQRFRRARGSNLQLLDLGDADCVDAYLLARLRPRLEYLCMEDYWRSHSAIVPSDNSLGAISFLADGHLPLFEERSKASRCELASLAAEWLRCNVSPPPPESLSCLTPPSSYPSDSPPDPGSWTLDPEAGNNLKTPTSGEGGFSMFSVEGRDSRACAACLSDVRVAALPGAREVLTLCCGIFRAEREGGSPPASTRDVDAAILACRRWRSLSPPRETDFLRVQPRSWGTIPKDVLRYLLQWLRALGGVGGNRGVDGDVGRAALYSSTLVCRAWNLIGTEELWRSVVVPGEPDSMGCFFASVKRSYKSCSVGHAPMGSHVRALHFEVKEEFPETSFEFLASPAVHFFPNLRSLAIVCYTDSAPLTLPMLANFFEYCTNLLALRFAGDIPYCEEAKEEDFWRTTYTGKAITEGVHRLRSLAFYTFYKTSHIVAAIHRATGPNLIYWSGHGRSATEVAANSPDLKSLHRPEHIAIIASRCHHLVTVELSTGIRNPTTDDAVQALLDHCPAIAELGLFNTAVTVVTIKALKSHRSLTFLSLGGYKHRGLFDSPDSENALCELPSARGGSLTRLRLGEPR